MSNNIEYFDTKGQLHPKGWTPEKEGYSLLGTKETTEFWGKIAEPELLILGSYSAIGSTESKHYEYSVSKGSQYGFAQKVGLEIAGGVNIPFVADGKVTISGELSWSQLFTETTVSTVEGDVKAGEKDTIYTAKLVIKGFEWKIQPWLEAHGKKNVKQPLKAFTEIYDTGAVEIHTTLRD